MDVWETKVKSHMNTEVTNVRTQKSSSSRSSKNPNRESPRRMDMEKKLSKPATPTTSSASKITKVRI